MHLSHITKYTIQNRNVHISVLNGVLCDMGRCIVGYGQVHCGIREIGLELPQAQVSIEFEFQALNH